METEGKIDGIEIKQTKKGNDYWVFTIAGKQWNCFDQDIAKEFKLGDFVRLRYEKDGKYYNMKEMKKAVTTEKAGVQNDNVIHVDLQEIIDLMKQILTQLASM